jgi:hypothetical protein
VAGVGSGVVAGVGSGVVAGVGSGVVAGVGSGVAVGGWKIDGTAKKPDPAITIAIAIASATAIAIKTIMGVFGPLLIPIYQVEQELKSRRTRVKGARRSGAAEMQ